MLVIIYPTGTKRSVHLNSYIAEAEKIFPNCKVINTEEFLEKHYLDWPKNTIFVVRLGSQLVHSIMPVLSKIWHSGHYHVFPNVPALKNCANKSNFYSLCAKHGINVPKFKVFADDGPEIKEKDFIDYKECVIKPSIGSLGSGIYLVKPDEVANKVQEILQTDNIFYKDCDIIVQEKIENSNNILQSIRVFCFLGEPTVGLTLINSQESSDIVSNLDKGGVVSLYHPNDELKNICRSICKITGIEFTALDFMQDQNGNFVCLEANVSPQYVKAHAIHKEEGNHGKMIFNYLDKIHKGSIITYDKY